MCTCLPAIMRSPAASSTPIDKLMAFAETDAQKLSHTLRARHIRGRPQLEQFSLFLHEYPSTDAEQGSLLMPGQYMGRLDAQPRRDLSLRIASFSNSLLELQSLRKPKV